MTPTDTFWMHEGGIGNGKKNRLQPFRGFCTELNRYCRGVLIIEGTETERKYTIEEYGITHEVDPSTVEEINF